MPDTIRSALLFLISTLFNLYLFVLIIRLILVWVGANYFDPVTQFIVKLTNFIVKPLRRYIPNIQHLETASLTLILLVEMIKFFLISFLNVGFPALTGIALLAVGDTIKLILEAFFYGILLQAILSWVQPGAPFNHVLYQFTSPIMRPIHRIIPPLAGIDISPIPALIILQLLIILIADPITSAGLGVVFG